MFDITKLALKIPNFLTHKECDGLINEFKQRDNESFPEHSKNSNTNKLEWNDFKVVPLIPKTPNFNLIKSKTKKIVNLYLEYLSKPNYFFIDLLKESLVFSHSYRIMKYEVGNSIHPHSDYAPHTYGSITFNLNKDYEGGEFKFFNGNYTIPLSKGDVLIFPADYFWVHEVTPVTKGIRYSINSFLKSHPSKSVMLGNYMADLIKEDEINRTPKEELLGPYN